MSLMDQPRRTHRAKLRMGPDGKDGLAIATFLWSVEGLGDAACRVDWCLSSGEALEVGHTAREVNVDPLALYTKSNVKEEGQ